MDGYRLIMKIQQKMKDPLFVQKFNEMSIELNNMPGLRDDVMSIIQIEDNKKRSKALKKLPKRVKEIVEELADLLNN